jgi:hypothetical protein
MACLGLDCSQPVIEQIALVGVMPNSPHRLGSTRALECLSYKRKQSSSVERNAELQPRLASGDG